MKKYLILLAALCTAGAVSVFAQGKTSLNIRCNGPSFEALGESPFQDLDFFFS